MWVGGNGRRAFSDVCVRLQEHAQQQLPEFEKEHTRRVVNGIGVGVVRAHKTPNGGAGRALNE